MKHSRSFFKKILQSPTVLTLIGYLTRGIISALFSTLRVKIEGVQELQKRISDSSKAPLIIAVWHNQLLLLAPLLQKKLQFVKATVMISKSRDGEIPAAFAKTYKGIDVIRVGHQNRHDALHKAVHTLSSNHILIITPDGPKGPVYEVKPGVIFCAHKTGAHIIPMGWRASRSIRLNSWDKLCIPLPFSTVTVTFGAPIAFSEEASSKRVDDEAENSIKSAARESARNINMQAAQESLKVALDALSQ